jgi:carotenoid cleavage oxygenase
MTNRYLQGPFAPLQQEYTLTDLEVAGTIPDYLDGRYLRNGPNPIGEIDPDLSHWFIGDGMVHGIRILACQVQDCWAGRPSTSGQSATVGSARPAGAPPHPGPPPDAALAT